MAATLLHDDDLDGELEEELDEDLEDGKEPVHYTIKSIPASLRASALQSVAERESWIISELMQENAKEYAECLGFSNPSIYYNVGYGHEYAYVEEQGSRSLDLDELTRGATTKDVPFRRECSTYASLGEAIEFARENNYSASARIIVHGGSSSDWRELEVTLEQAVDDDDMLPRHHMVREQAEKMVEEAFESLVDAIERELLSSLRSDYEYFDSEAYLVEVAESHELLFDEDGDIVAKP